MDRGGVLFYTTRVAPVPRSVPSDVIEGLAAGCRTRHLGSRKAQRGTRSLGIDAKSMTPHQLDAGFAKEMEKWAEIAREANIRRSDVGWVERKRNPSPMLCPE